MFLARSSFSACSFSSASSRLLAPLSVGVRNVHVTPRTERLRQAALHKTQKANEFVQEAKQYSSLETANPAKIESIIWNMEDKGVRPTTAIFNQLLLSHVNSAKVSDESLDNVINKMRMSHAPVSATTYALMFEGYLRAQPALPHAAEKVLDRLQDEFSIAPTKEMCQAVADAYLKATPPETNLADQIWSRYQEKK